MYLNGIVHNHGKTEKSCFFFGQLQMFDVCTTGDTAYIDTIFKFLPRTRQHGCIDIFHCWNDRAFRSARSRGNGGTNTLHEMHVAQ